MKNKQDNIRQIQEITWAGIAVNICLALLKFAAGIFGASQALIADAVHSVSDISTDVMVLVGVKFWSKPPDDAHPYGHSRIETAITIMIGIVLFFVAFKIAGKALSTIRGPHIVQPKWIAFWGALVSILVKEALYRVTLAVGKQAKSTALVSNAWHHRSDAMSSVPVALAVAASAINPQWSFIDHIGALIVSLLIFRAAWKIIRPAVEEFLGKGVSEIERKKIRDIALGVDQVETIHAIRSRKMGPNIFVDLHVLVDGRMTVSEGHNVSERVKKALLEEIDDVIDVVVHLEPET